MHRLPRRLLLLSLLAGAAPAGARSFAYDAGVPPEVRVLFEKDLAAIGAIRGTGASPLHRSLFGPNVDGRSYVSFFEDKIHSVGFDARPEMAQRGVFAYVDASVDPHRIVLTTRILHAGETLVPVLEAFLHEARHSQEARNHYAHVLCPEKGADGEPVTSGPAKVPLAGLYACDDQADGAYGIAATLLLNLARRCTNCSLPTREYAELYGRDSLRRIIEPGAHDAVKDDIDGFGLDSETEPLLAGKQITLNVEVWR